MPDPSVFDEYVNEEKQLIDVAGYNAKVQEINAQIKQNWEQYKTNRDNGTLVWKYGNSDIVPSLANRVPNETFTTEINGETRTGYKYVKGVNHCIRMGYSTSSITGCNNLTDTMQEAQRLQTLAGTKVYVNCYTGTFYNFDGSFQTSDPGTECSDPKPAETDEDGAPRGYLTLMDTKQVAEAFGMGDMEIYTDLVGATKVDQKSNGGGLAFGYKVAMSVRPFESKKTTVSVVYTSPVTFDLKGSLDATTYIGGSMGDVNMKADLTLTATLPSQLQLAIMHSFGKLNVEFVYEEIYWSKGDKFTFNFSNPHFTPLSGMVMQFTPDQLANMMDLADYGAVAMGDGWKDTIALRLGLTYLTQKNTLLMLSAALDQAPVPQDKLGIPDSNAYMFGIGAKKMFTKWNAGIAYSLSLKDGRKSIYQTGALGQLHLLSASLGRQF